MGKDLKGKELGKGIRQLRNGRFEARYVDRFGKRRSLYGDNLVEVRHHLKVAQAEDALKLNGAKKVLLDDWYQTWMNTYKLPVIRKNTKRHYETIYLKHISPYIGRMYLSELKQIHIKDLVNRLNKQGYQWETQNKVKIMLIDMLDRAIENDLILKNPARGVRIPKRNPQIPFALTVEQQEEFFRCSMGTFYDNLFRTMVSSGLRAGEICALEESDLDFNGKVIHVSKTLLYQKLDGDAKKEFHIENPKTASSKRDVPMNDYCEQALRRQLILKKIVSNRNIKQTNFPGLLFVTKYNTPINPVVLNDAIARIINEVNLQKDESEQLPKFSSHAFRHTFATRCFESGIKPKVISKYLGHATVQMTMDLYVHADEQCQALEMQKLKGFLPEPECHCSLPDFAKGVKMENIIEKMEWGMNKASKYKEIV